VRLLKVALAFLVTVVSVQTIPALYHSNKFDDFVKQEVKRPRTIRTTAQISQDILNKAGQYSVPVRAEDIDVSTTGRVVRVEVKYRIPIDLLVYSPEMRFRSIGGGLLND
jgi:hypothetical protein